MFGINNKFNSSFSSVNTHQGAPFSVKRALVSALLLSGGAAAPIGPKASSTSVAPSVPSRTSGPLTTSPANTILPNVPESSSEIPDIFARKSPSNAQGQNNNSQGGNNQDGNSQGGHTTSTPSGGGNGGIG